MPNTFGHQFRLTSFGESHGLAVGGIVDGCPAGIELSVDKIQAALDRRKPGQSVWTTSRQEGDRIEILSGVEDGFTLGTPIAFSVRNQDQKKGDYAELQNVFRPSHADFTTQMKYGIRAKSGGGRLSARETLARVAAGSIAEQMLQNFIPELKVLACVSSLHKLNFSYDESTLCSAQIESNPFRCPDADAIPQIESLLSEVRSMGDSVGGCIDALAFHVPIGWGDPVFDKLHADLGKALLSIPAAKAFEVGSGFQSTTRLGSENNDAFHKVDNRIRTLSNHSGGIQGGISNGETIKMRVGFKAPSSIFREQQTVDKDGNPLVFRLEKGRHDPCVLPRAVPIVEAMVYLVLADHFVRQQMYVR